MFISRRRHAEPVELANVFTSEEAARITRLQRQYHAAPACFHLDISYRRLEFARWLVSHGRLDEWRQE